MAIRNFEAELDREILGKLMVDRELRRKTKEFVEDVRDYARRQALEDMTKGYATGEFVASIKLERRRNARGQFVAGPAWRVASHDDKANLLEYGTGDDNPDSRSPWGPYTPTPAYATFAKTALHYHGTPDSGVNSRGLSAIAIRHGDKALENARPIRQYSSSAKEFEEPQGTQDLRSQYVKWLKSPEALALQGKRGNTGRGKR